ncbi:hypothetical protein B0F90DRAFT_1727626 [Multifurca ochricompacta]|uniref:F-box domain-containing protein n=1 Tax=Multifurca ochricompacta TaxID=376703 RepID=A0AAD4M3Z5_9AGAM|nr:hypothetical protein B0F90DRAFT_1727626 [Multifurca ochricompacta]
MAAPNLPSEIWAEIASYLPRRDLRTLLFIPHVLSSLASRQLSRNVFLKFGTAQFDTWCKAHPMVARSVELDARRSFEILLRLASDPSYANLVESLAVYALGNKERMSAHIELLIDVLPKLTNLKVFTCSLDDDVMASVFGVLESSQPSLQVLVIEPGTYRHPPPPKLSQVRRFAYCARGIKTSTEIDHFLSAHTDALHTLIVYHIFGRYESSLIFTQNLRTLHLSSTITNPDFISEILTHGQQLKSLRLEIYMDPGCFVSTAFRAHAGSKPLPALRKFAFVLRCVGSLFEDPDLFPAVAEFLREHPALTSLSIVGLSWLDTVGYNAKLWNALPAFIGLRALKISVPNDLLLTQGASLIPRSVVALDLPALDEAGLIQMLPGLPSGLKFLSLPFDVSPAVRAVMCQGFPALRLVILNHCFYTIHRASDGHYFEHWSLRQAKFFVNESLEELDCEEARFLFSRLIWDW